MSFFIKFGEEEHLKQIVNGTIMFSPSQTYMKMEEEQHNKGQGDLLEGKLKITCKNVWHYNELEHEYNHVASDCIQYVKFENVNNMPIFCLSYFDERYLTEKNKSKIIDISCKLPKIMEDFPKATHALIIFEPEKFTQDIYNINAHSFADDKIHYYDYDNNSIMMYIFITTGSMCVPKCINSNLSYNDRYRCLLCKDNDFKHQVEYRYICLDELIEEPVFYNFNFTSRYMVVPIEQLKKPYRI